MSTSSFKSSSITTYSSLPEGKILSQAYFSRADIKRIVDNQSGSGTFNTIIGNPITDAIIQRLLVAGGFSNPVSFVASAILWASSDLSDRSNSWWIDSFIMILEGRISYVKCTIIENTISEYPKAYRILERI